jgi:hypothetical protein
MPFFCCKKNKVRPANNEDLNETDSDESVFVKPEIPTGDDMENIRGTSTTRGTHGNSDSTTSDISATSLNEPIEDFKIDDIPETCPTSDDEMSSVTNYSQITNKNDESTASTKKFDKCCPIL